MVSQSYCITALIVNVSVLAGCQAHYRDVSAQSPYKERIGEVCEVVAPLRAHGYAFELGPDQKTDEVSIWNPGFSGPEVTFVLWLQPGANLTLLDARECTNCPLDPNPEYRVLVKPEPPEFDGKPSYLRATSLTPAYLRCARDDNHKDRSE
jgi:hypothetical protein